LIRKLLASASLVVLSSTAVLAADLPAHYAKAPVMAAPVFNWTGCYVGVHGGGGAMHEKNDSRYPGGSSTSQNGNGGLAGGQAGCNYQDGNWVFGVEGEGYWSGIKSSNSNSSNSEGYAETAKSKNDFSIAARAGITFDRTLVYGKAGWVWGRFDFNRATTYNNCLTDCVDSYSRNGTLDGLLLGVGIEHALTQNWTVKLEYNYLNFGAKEMAETYCNGGICFPNGSYSSSATKQIFKVGANYLFNWGSVPLVAKN
jgi:outer membrane immunogenic protein